MATKTFAEQYLPGIPGIQQQTFGQGYGNWQKYAEPQDSVAPPATDSSAPMVGPALEDTNFKFTKPKLPIVGVIPPTSEQQAEAPNSYQTPENSSGIGGSWSAGVSGHYGDY